MTREPQAGGGRDLQLEKYQDINPFKFILYSGKIGARTPPIEAPRPRRGTAAGGQ
jgi:hypothetical protein